MSERKELYPQPTPEVAARRNRLAPGPADCIRGHTRAALRQGATPEEIMEAIWVAAEMRAGGAYAHSALALDEIAAHEAGTQP